MKKLALVLATTLASTPAMAGPYVNVESNSTSTGNNFQSRATDLHVGYENSLANLDWYVQGGQTINAADGVDSENSWSGKLGGSVAASQRLGIYGEVSFANLFDEDTDNTYGTKLGAKYSF